MAKMIQSTLTSKGQVTVPAPVRAALAVRSGDRLTWTTREDGVVEVRKVGRRDLDALVGMLGRPDRSVTVEEMDEALRKRFRESLKPVLSVDTNVLVRLVVSDDLTQQQQARERLEAARSAGERVLVTTVVLAEVSWVLDSVYGYGREAIAQVMDAIAETPPLHLERHDAVIAAVAAFRQGGPDFSGHLILSLASAAGALPLLTFDKKLARLAGTQQP